MFEAMFRREDEIENPEYGTFEWILEGIDSPEPRYDTGSYVPTFAWSHGHEDAFDEYSDSVRDSKKVRAAYPFRQSDLYHSSLLVEGDGNHKDEERHSDKDWTSQASGSSGGLDSLNDEVQQDYGTPDQRAQNDFNRSAMDASGVKLHGVYYRSDPSISKIHGNEPCFAHGAVSGWKPHLQHIISISEHAKKRMISEAFASFLRHGQGVYFCCGKAGSGKSTFMKHISRHQKIIRELQTWSGAKKLVLIKIFFWNSGDEMQMSMEGFYRSLLFQVLQQCPESLPEIFPRQAEGEEFMRDIRGNMLPFRFSELQEAVRRLLQTAWFPKHRFCFFIDGLDEFKGDSVDGNTSNSLNR